MFVDVRTYDGGVVLVLSESDVTGTTGELLTRLLLAHPPRPMYNIRLRRYYAEIYPDIHGQFCSTRDAIENAYEQLGAPAAILAATGFRRWSLYDQLKPRVIPFPICTLSAATMSVWMVAPYLDQLWEAEVVVECQRIVLRPTWPPYAQRAGLLGIGTYEMCARLALGYCQKIEKKFFEKQRRSE